MQAPADDTNVPIENSDFISGFQASQFGRDSGDVLFNLAENVNKWRGFLLPLLFGAVFACLLFGLFAAKILQGPAFPELGVPKQSTNANSASTPIITETQEPKPLEIKDYLSDTVPRNGVSFAILLIWSFIAGFAERLVPDMLNSLVAKNEAIHGTKT